MTRGAGARFALFAATAVCLAACGRGGEPGHAIAGDAAAQAELPSRPNVLLVLSDDQGWGDVGYNGHPYLRTPKLDSLAGQGMTFTRFYAAAPVCSPTRASVLTGRHPLRMGIENPNQGRFPDEETTLAEIAQSLGYVTGHFGKWHLGTLTTMTTDSNRGAPGNTADYSPPWQQGYEVVFATEAKVPTYDPMQDPENPGALYGTAYWVGPEAAVPAADPSLAGDDSRVIVDRVIPFVERAVARGTPFFATVWLHSPHEPVVFNPNDHAWVAEAGELDEAQRAYASSIRGLDDQVGRLWAALERLGVSDNTLFAFASDNGPSPHYTGSSGGLRGFKQDLYEGGVRVPAFFVWPEVIPGGSRSDDPAVTSDYLPTLLEIWRADAPQRPLDGRSLLPQFRREPPTGRQIAFAFTLWNAERDRPLPQRMALLDNPWKLISQDYGETWELYDLAADPAETNDIAAAHPAIVSSLREDWLAWLADTKRSRAGADYENRQP